MLLQTKLAEMNQARIEYRAISGLRGSAQVLDLRLPGNFGLSIAPIMKLQLSTIYFTLKQMLRTGTSILVDRDGFAKDGYVHY